MGQELECTMRFHGTKLPGKAQLETDYLLFRGAERLKVTFRELTGVTATAGVLKLDFDGGPAELELGRAAEKWADKILHPPSRLDKLGIKPGLRVKLVGEFDGAFREELENSGTKLTGARAKADLVLFAAGVAEDLERTCQLAEGIERNGAIWVVYPKGIKAIREIDVITAGRTAGLKDVKVAAFSATHTALKFVIPVAER